jgi:hypothetical protein
VVIFCGSIGRQCLGAGQADELLIHIAPVLLRAGALALQPGDNTLRSFNILPRCGPDEMTSLRLKPQR